MEDMNHETSFFEYIHSTEREREREVRGEINMWERAVQTNFPHSHSLRCINYCMGTFYYFFSYCCGFIENTPLGSEVCKDVLLNIKRIKMKERRVNRTGKSFKQQFCEHLNVYIHVHEWKAVDWWGISIENVGGSGSKASMRHSMLLRPQLCFQSELFIM